MQVRCVAVRSQCSILISERMQGGLYRTKAKGIRSPGGVSLVLGAGNQASVVSSDILFKLIHEDEVVIVKTNPVNEYIGKHLE